jgi:hypothetical protein
VSNALKILTRMRNNPRDSRIEDLQALAARYGVDFDQNGTSHVTFRHAEAGRLTVPAARPIRAIYVRMFVAFLEKLEG